MRRRSLPSSRRPRAVARASPGPLARRSLPTLRGPVGSVTRCVPSVVRTSAGATTTPSRRCGRSTRSRAPQTGGMATRGAFSCRPDRGLGYYAPPTDSPACTDMEGRSEIAHQGHRLTLSKCFQEKVCALSCTTCHDPHHTMPAADLAEHFRAACYTCHDRAACLVARSTPTASAGTMGAERAGRGAQAWRVTRLPASLSLRS